MAAFALFIYLPLSSILQQKKFFLKTFKLLTRNSNSEFFCLFYIFILIIILILQNFSYRQQYQFTYAENMNYVLNRVTSQIKTKWYRIL